MIIFHEGMPGSGKSFAAMKDHIIPALKKGRKVFARMNGLDHAKIAEVSGLSSEVVDGLLVELDETQVARVYEVVEKDSLLVLDELQNFFPRGRGALSPEMTKFIAEHRHHGLDILCMGQLLKDCHSTWINRVNRKIQFLNKDVLGKPNEYKWKMYNGTPDGNGNVKFAEVSAGSADYDPKYFGTYRSFREETENTERLTDQRAVVWNNPVFKKWLPILGVFSIVGLGYVVWLFSGGLGVSKAPPKTAAVPVSTVSETYKDGKLVARNVEGQEAAKVKEPAKAQEEKEPDWPDPVSDYSRANRIRVAGVVRSASKTIVEIEWRDDSMRVMDRMTGDQLRLLGWRIMVGDDNQSVLLVSQNRRLFATAWPIPDLLGNVSGAQTDQLKEEGRKRVAPGVVPLAMVQE